jgi:hypothetical protein
MLEDLTMDKKSATGVRPSQFPAKQASSNNNDCKKLQGIYLPMLINIMSGDGQN